MKACAVSPDLLAEVGGRLTAVDKVKASKLSGYDNMLYRRNSETGQVEGMKRDAVPAVVLNETLHANAATTA